ncbi:MAG: hypothetical protein JSS51_01710 [Planctomycetes bacterium]|nr:hypothetical protein [Planctomycetota bacterium]
MSSQNSQPPPPSDPEAAAGDALPEPILPPRALGALRQAFAPLLEVSTEADVRVLNELNKSRRQIAHKAGFWRGLQIAAVLGVIASVMFYMESRRTQLAATNPLSGPIVAHQRENAARMAEKSSAASTDSVAAASPTDAGVLPPAPAGVANPGAQARLAWESANKPVTILDAFNLARAIEQRADSKSLRKGFQPTGERISEFDEVNRIAAAAVGAEPSQVPSLEDHGVDTEKDAKKASPGADARAFDRLSVSPESVADTRILTYDVMLDVGSRSLAAFQIEISLSAPDTAHVTGLFVRGGDHPALKRQPLFDSKRVSRPGARTSFTIANFDTGNDLPSGDVRVARIVLVVVGKGNPGLTARLVVAAGPEGVPIPAGLRVSERSPIAGSDILHQPLEKAVEKSDALPPGK